MEKNGKVKLTITSALVLAIVLMVIGIVWDASSKSSSIDENKKEIAEVSIKVEKGEAKAHYTEIEMVGIKKDIKHLNESVGRIETEQKTSFKAIIDKLDKLPKYGP